MLTVNQIQFPYLLTCAYSRHPFIMTYITAASFLPDSLVIRLSKNITAFANSDDIEGFTPSNIGLFFHEWVHYLHNVSTLHGLSSFENAISIWSNFRFTCRAGMYSGGSKSLPTNVALDTAQRLAYWRASRLPSKSVFPDKTLDELCLLSVSTQVERIPDSEYEVVKLACRVGTVDRPEDETVVVVGSYEILEGVAWMLEDKLNTALKQISARVPSSPYHIVRNLFRLRYPELSDNDVIACMLCSLQDSDPPAVLAMLFKSISKLSDGIPSVIEELKSRARQTISSNESFATDIIKNIEQRFPVDEPMARAVKSVIATIKSNLKHRYEDTFFEFSIIESVRQNLQKMDDAIKKHGGCCVIQDRQGGANEITRDLMYDFVTKEERDEGLEFGWRKMHAAFHFMQLHLSEQRFIPTGEVPTGAHTSCPFYATCNLPSRIAHASVCQQTPWKWSETENDRDTRCWYAAATTASLNSAA